MVWAARSSVGSRRACRLRIHGHMAVRDKPCKGKTMGRPAWIYRTPSPVGLGQTRGWPLAGASGRRAVRPAASRQNCQLAV